MDLALDIVVEPDRSTWRWKDEDEFDLFLARGVLDPEVGARVREEAAAIIERITRNESPFDSDWPSWRPDPAWGTPALPPDWDVF
jgi:predicted RNA-binding protein associated with RNAse of E/G family